MWKIWTRARATPGTRPGGARVVFQLFGYILKIFTDIMYTHNDDVIFLYTFRLGPTSPIWRFLKIYDFLDNFYIPPVSNFFWLWTFPLTRALPGRGPGAARALSIFSRIQDQKVLQNAQISLKRLSKFFGGRTQPGGPLESIWSHKPVPILKSARVTRWERCDLSMSKKLKSSLFSTKNFN